MQTVIAFLAILLPLAFSPGPAAIALAGLGMHQGILRSLPFYFGLLISVFILAVASAYGMTAIFLGNDLIYQAIRFTGIAYVLYLGIKFLFAKPTVGTLAPSEYTLLDGILLTTLNPKFYALIVAIFSQFPASGPKEIWILILGFTATLAASQLVWLAAGASLRPLMNSVRAQKIQNIVFGLSLLLCGIYLIAMPQ